MYSSRNSALIEIATSSSSHGDLRLAGTSMALDGNRPLSLVLSILRHGAPQQGLSGTLASGSRARSLFEMRLTAKGGDGIYYAQVDATNIHEVKEKREREKERKRGKRPFVLAYSNCDLSVQSPKIHRRLRSRPLLSSSS